MVFGLGAKRSVLLYLVRIIVVFMEQMLFRSYKDKHILQLIFRSSAKVCVVAACCPGQTYHHRQLVIHFLIDGATKLSIVITAIQLVYIFFTICTCMQFQFFIKYKYVLVDVYYMLLIGVLELICFSFLTHWCAAESHQLCIPEQTF